MTQEVVGHRKYCNLFKMPRVVESAVIIATAGFFYERITAGFNLIGLNLDDRGWILFFILWVISIIDSITKSYIASIAADMNSYVVKPRIFILL
jgi:hypothetical protein